MALRLSEGLGPTGEYDILGESFKPFADGLHHGDRDMPCLTRFDISNGPALSPVSSANNIAKISVLQGLASMTFVRYFG